MPKFTPLRCTATIPLDEQNGVECNALASVICDEGPRCQSCYSEWGGTLVTFEPERKQPTPFDLGSLMCLTIDRLTGGVL